MGTKLSSNKDFNRVLATQPRRSIDIPKFDGVHNLQQQSVRSSLVIPDPVRISQAKDQSVNATPLSANKLSVVNPPFKSNQRALTSSSIESTNLSPVIDQQTQQKSEGKQSEQQIVQRNSSFSVRSNLLGHFQTMNSNPVVIHRSVIDLHDHRQLRNHHHHHHHHHHLSSRPHHNVVERNGKQFRIEFRERAERRYVQWFDQTIGRMRLFEVIDYIPCKIVKPIRHNSQSLLHHGASQNTSLPSNQRAALQSIPNGQSASSNPVNFNGSHNRDNLLNESSLQQNPVNFPVTGSTPISSSQSQPLSARRLSIQSSSDSNYTLPKYSSPKVSNHSHNNSQNAYNQHSSIPLHAQASSFRAHTPSVSGHSTPSEDYSTDSDEESETDDDRGAGQTIRPNSQRIDYNPTNPYMSNDRNDTTVFYGKSSGNNSLTPLDPFARPVHIHEHYYRKRPFINSYAEPILTNSKFRQHTHSDYAPL